VLILSIHNGVGFRILLRQGFQLAGQFTSSVPKAAPYIRTYFYIRQFLSPLVKRLSISWHAETEERLCCIPRLKQPKSPEHHCTALSSVHSHKKAQDIYFFWKQTVCSFGWWLTAGTGLF
jgi:hypothetical protein